MLHTYLAPINLTSDQNTVRKGHCVKSVQIRSLFWSVFSCIRTEHRKIRTRKNSVFGYFSHSGYYDPTFQKRIQNPDKHLRFFCKNCQRL